MGRWSPSNISRHHPEIANRSSTHAWAQPPLWAAGPLRRPGGDLLSRALRRSTIGAEGFHGRVRDGIGWGTLAMTTRSSKRTHPAPGPAWGRRQRTPAFVFKSRVVSTAKFGVRAPASPLRMAHLKPIERLVPVSSTHCCASTPGLSTWWSPTALKGELVSREASRLDAFSGYPVRT